eukprot:jgi/Bigna1/146939/aug1.125_g21647
MEMLKEHRENMMENVRGEVSELFIRRHESLLDDFEKLWKIVFEVSTDFHNEFRKMTSEQILKISDVVKNIHLESRKPDHWNEKDDWIEWKFECVHESSDSDDE